MGATLAAAAVALLVVLRDPSTRQDEQGGNHVKGGELSFELVSERGHHDPTRFAQHERFKVLVTCPPDFAERLHLLVFQGGQRYEPLAPIQLACGNQVPWSGAFALDGDQPAEVCVAWGARAARAQRAGDLSDDAVCSMLAPD
ncbi:MAG: hypothetical protein QM778_25590 [Myxococcales bacterium]